MINRVWDQVLSEYLAQSDFQLLLEKLKKIDDNKYFYDTPTTKII